ncbi:DUF4222 domain-containing protein [Pantoea agglomerans]|uniref:DUF4222 domain-containing protein n=1 Tax=Enterobacter agglomerans TaxID=549 RepID=UPI001302A2DD|nr:DUF4222 domain-containing protein [Pantoea agglomerans]QGY58499.1 DUF4222 domain-containing protein [Pantoea agglomerans]WNK43052.1 DUF4222 domain-containing protein [Pantoea agglomerans]
MPQLSDEIIQPWVARYTDPRGVIVETIGVDVTNNRVLFRRPGYPYVCVQPRNLWGQKFRRVSDER